MKLRRLKPSSAMALGAVSQEPRLYVLSRPVFDQREIRKFSRAESIKWTQTARATDAERMIEFAGRICYMSFGKYQSPKSTNQFIQHLIRQGHDSVLEHASWTFLLTGVSRAFTHQMVRHRIGFSFSQLSQQYHDERDARFVVPKEVRSNPAVMKRWIRLIKELRQAYNSISRELQGTSNDGLLPKETLRSVRSAARSILPNATETKIVFTANGRSLRHFLAMRGAIVGDMEMRRVSALMFSCLGKEAPALLTGFEMLTYEDGFPLIAQKPIE